MGRGKVAILRISVRATRIWDPPPVSQVRSTHPQNAQAATGERYFPCLAENRDAAEILVMEIALFFHISIMRWLARQTERTSVSCGKIHKTLP
jgi:hypothetical protein